jgi:hypothetical protein
MWELLVQNFAKRNVSFTEEEFEVMKSMLCIRSIANTNMFYNRMKFAGTNRLL